MKQANGFTLVELLAAMVTGSLLLASLSWTVSGLARQLPEEADDARTIEAIAPSLIRMLEQAAPPTRDKATFSASSRALSAIVPPPLAAGAAGPLRLSLAIRPSAEGAGLFAAFAPLDRGSAFPPAAARERLLVGGFRSISFEVAEAQPRGDRQPRLPRLITIVFTGQDGRTHRTSAAPRLDSDGSCRFDPISMTCRA